MAVIIMIMHRDWVYDNKLLSFTHSETILAIEFKTELGTTHILKI